MLLLNITRKRGRNGPVLRPFNKPYFPAAFQAEEEALFEDEEVGVALVLGKVGVTTVFCARG